MLHCLDHVVVAVRDLEPAAALTTTLLGRPPSWRGVHPGAGTANALYRLHNTTLELLTPAGEGAVGAAVSGVLDGRGEGVVALAFGTDDADACVAAWRERGLAVFDPQAGEGHAEEGGAVRHWRTALLAPDAARGLWIFAIEQRSPPDALP